MQPTVLPLWPGAAPGSEDWNWPEREVVRPPSEGVTVVLNVARPTLTVSLPDPDQGDAPANGAAIVVCPGGAFHLLAIEHEGHEVARWLNAHGIAAGVLKYRVIHTGEDFEADMQANMGDRDRWAEIMAWYRPMMLADGQQALRIMRGAVQGAHANEWGIDPQRVGIMGFSAGGSLTLAVGLADNDESNADAKPDFLGVIYGGGHGTDAVPSDAPPLFTLCAADDRIAAPGIVGLYQAWKEAGVPVELHIYAKGGHGFGMRPQGLPTDGWIERFAEWLAEIGITGS